MSIIQKRRSISVRATTYPVLQAAAARENRSISDWVEDAIAARCIAVGIDPPPGQLPQAQRAAAAPRMQASATAVVVSALPRPSTPPRPAPTAPRSGRAPGPAYQYGAFVPKPRPPAPTARPVIPVGRDVTRASLPARSLPSPPRRLPDPWQLP